MEERMLSDLIEFYKLKLKKVRADIIYCCRNIKYRSILTVPVSDERWEAKKKDSLHRIRAMLSLREKYIQDIMKVKKFNKDHENLKYELKKANELIKEYEEEEAELDDFFDGLPCDRGDLGI